MSRITNSAAGIWSDLFHSRSLFSYSF